MTLRHWFLVDECCAQLRDHEHCCSGHCHWSKLESEAVTGQSWSRLEWPELRVEIVSPVLLHRHVPPHPGQVVQVYISSGHTHPPPTLSCDHAPGVHYHTVTIAAPLLIVLTSLSCCYHIALSLHCSGSQQCLPVRHPSVDSEC